MKDPLMSLDYILNPLPQKWFSGVPLQLVHRADKIPPSRSLLYFNEVS